MFQKGPVSNPNGRPVGSRNKRTKELWETLEGRGDKDPIDYLSDIVTHGKDETLRIQAAGLLIPYKHSKVQSTPAPRFVETELTLPPLDSLEHAVQSIAFIETAVAENRLDVQSANDLIGMINAYIAGKNIMEIAELQERLTNIEASIANNPQAQLPHIEGGLPTPPGFENVIMPRINGIPASLPSPSPAPSPGLGEPSQANHSHDHHANIPRHHVVPLAATRHSAHGIDHKDADTRPHPRCYEFPEQRF
jgi:hypothetical protein